MRARLFLALVAIGFIGSSSDAQNVTSTIAFTSTRENPNAVPPIVGGEIYLMDRLPNGSFSAPRQLTENCAAGLAPALTTENCYADTFPALSPDGKGRIVFDSNRMRAAGEPINTSDLFLMNHDGTDQVFLTRGGSPTWAPPDPKGNVSKVIAFHASASGAGLPINPFPGSATDDSDIFTVNVDDVLQNVALPRNLTANRVETVDDDPNWSPDGRKILFTSYIPDPTTTLTPAEIYVMNADGTGQQQMTSDGIEKRGPAWSPNGAHILFACRMGPVNANGDATFEICVMDAVANAPLTRLTFNNPQDLTPTWSPDGGAIVFHRNNQLWTKHLDGNCMPKVPVPCETPLTIPPGNNLLATSWGLIQVGSGRK
jgi:TolB protein